MFHDRARIQVQAGRGGDGGLSFRREKFVPKGGPDGGDGGRGGDVVLVADPDLRDLSALRSKRVFKGGRGEPGRGSGKHGADGADVELQLPVGTQVFAEDDSIVADLVAPGARVVVARGGTGRARATATSRRRRARHRASRRPGSPGEEAELELRLKLRRRRRTRRPAERRQVVAAAADLEREAESRRLSVHDSPAGARHGRLARRPAADRRRRARPDRGGEPGRRARARVPRPSRACAAARPRDRRGCRRSRPSSSARSTTSSPSTAPASTSGGRWSC